MSFFDCVQRALDGEEVDTGRAKRAQEMWQSMSDEYEAQGRPRHVAEVLAGEDVKLAFKKEFGDKRHVAISSLAAQRNIQARLQNAPDIAKAQSESVERLDYASRGLVRRFNGRLAKFLQEHHRDIAGRVTKPAQMRNVLRELHGEATGDAAAEALSKGVREALEDMRLMANEAGGIIGKLDNYGVPHSHNRRAITKAGYDQWYSDIEPNIDWTRIENFATGRPFQIEGGPLPSLATRQRFMREIWENISFGKGSDEAVYGRAQGEALYKSQARPRTLHFKNADAWVDYNTKYGTGDPFKSLMTHVHSMARDIAAMRSFGPNPRLGVDYQKQLAMKTARDKGLPSSNVEGNGALAQRMYNVQSGGAGPETLAQDYISTFLSSARHVMTSAFLDRAIIASLSDVNTMRLAARSVGMNPNNVMSRHAKMMASSMEKEDALRAGWIADTLADPGVAMARFQAEVPPAEIAERLSSASMRVQGLSGWTDAGRMAFQMEMSGLLASQSGRKIKDVDEPLRSLLRKNEITDDEWAAFTKDNHLFRAGNGATFASPMYWREATDMDPRAADRVFDKIQSLIEEQTEFAVPTQSLLARGYTDPAAFNMPAGSIPYEVMKSGLAFKSFAMTFTVNQYRRIASQPTMGGKIGYGFRLAAGATVMGGVSLQIGELIKGNDPMEMTQPDFWGRAALKGGGFGIIGDIVNTGQSSWGGGFGSYVSGPVPQLLGDAWDLTIKNGIELAMGEDTNFAAELARYGKRYTPMGQTPLLGPAVDRLFWDQLQTLIDPESSDAIRKASRARKNRDGNDAFWVPGQVAPSRLPDLGGITGK